jgi:predicted TIM-barrel fold metal-dependent hydrolase
LPHAFAAGWDCHVHVFDAAAPVRPGHYRPVHRPLAQIEATARAHGIGHLVLVQPSVYGTDNTVLLRALQAMPGRHRGVAVLDATTSDAELDRLHAAGVRGARFNLVSPTGHAGHVEPELLQLAPRLRARAWHVQWYVQAEQLPQLVRWQARTGLRFVLDHLAGLHANLPDDHPAWTAAQALADAGAWLKLSGWYRLQAAAPYAVLLPAIRRVAALFGPRLVWGSDWPHTSFAPDQMPGYASTLDPARAGLAGPAFHALLHTQPGALYL